MGIHQKLSDIQEALKVPKNQKNNFANYNYRSCEDILETAKPLVKEKGCVLFVSDDIVGIGERAYVKAVATIIDLEDQSQVVATAFAREPLSKKGMDESQITGAASSYARKYALNGLFCIDDTKDADSMKPEEPKTNAKPEIICPECKKPVNGTKTKNGGYLTSEQIMDQWGECTDCVKKRKDHAS